MRRWTVFSSAVLAVLLVSGSDAQSCSSSSKCPSSAPCCSATGACGSGAYHCVGCQPMASFSPSSCSPNPVCTNKNITFAPSDYKNADIFRPILLYNGNSSVAPFTLDNGFLSAGPEGVILQLTAPTQTKLSSTEYVLYGNMELTARHNALQGLVFTFITMSDTKDEIDNEQTTADGSTILTNFFSQGQTVPGSSETINGGSGFDVADWHTYGINWQPAQLQWLIDGRVVKTIRRSAVGNQYPSSPSRVQISVWAGGNETNTQGVIDWSGGPISYTSAEYTRNGYYSAEIRSFSVQCGSQTVSGVGTTGNGTSPTSWVYTSDTSTTLNEPAFLLSSDPITTIKNPSAGGHVGLPGYSTQSAYSKSNSNAWDGSGDTSGLSADEISGSSSSGGWLANNKTLSIAVPVIAVLLAIIAIWALIACCRRRRRRAAENSAFAATKETGSLQYNAGNKASSILGKPQARQSSYSKLDDDEYEEDVPVGAQRYGAGYGPAAGPSPGMPAQRHLATSSDNSAQRRSDNGFESYPMQSRQQQPSGYNRVASPTPFSYGAEHTPSGGAAAYPSLPPGGYAVPAYTAASAARPLPQPQYNTRAYPQPPSSYPQQQSTYPQQSSYPQQRTYPQQSQPRQTGPPSHLQYQQYPHAQQQSGGANYGY